MPLVHTVETNNNQYFTIQIPNYQKVSPPQQISSHEPWTQESQSSLESKYPRSQEAEICFVKNISISVVVWIEKYPLPSYWIEIKLKVESWNQVWNIETLKRLGLLRPMVLPCCCLVFFVTVLCLWFIVLWFILCRIEQSRGGPSIHVVKYLI